MADDIDIEEHDVVDDPLVHNIFPCITNIKSEVMDYDDENEYQEYIDHKKVIKTEPLEYETNTNINSNVIIFGTKPSTPQSYKASTSTNKKNLVNKVSYENDHDDYNNGTDNNPDIIPCSVVLEDWHSLLVNNSCYCTECEILFPTRNTIESHRMTAHSFLVAVSNNKAVKSTSKSSIRGYNQTNNIENPDLLCQHCNNYFSSKSDLITHLNSLLPHAEESSIAEKSQLRDYCDTELSKKNNLYTKCTICSAFYKQKGNFVWHTLLNHAERDLEIVMARFDPYCKHCNMYLNTPKKYNCHLSLRHTDMYLMRMNYREGFYQCHICKDTFTSAANELEHRAVTHPVHSKHCGIKFRRALMLGKTVKNTNTIPPSFEKHSSENATVKNKNITTIGPKFLNNESNTIDNNKLVPKSHLFKCDMCQTHYISPSVAFEHNQHCTLSKGDWKCKPCKRTFTIADRQMHISQHALNARFKVIVISEEILERVVNRCGKCNVCFDDKTFSKYHASGCKPCPSVICDICHLRINKFAFKSHSRTHTELGLERTDFIITDYVKISKYTTSPKKAKNATSTYTVKNYNKVYYCSNCKMYTTRHRIQDGHEKGDCIDRRCGRELCKLCGLVFSKKGLVTHKAYHKMFNLKLNTMTIVNIINGKRIRPPFPEFMLCTRCQVYFVSIVALQNHVCDAEEHKSCQFCHKKFSDLALKLHSPFHRLANSSFAMAKRLPTSKMIVNNVLIGKEKQLALKGVKTSAKESEPRIPTPIHDLIRKYESLVTVWNILYRCQTCDIVFDSYDSMVEHCQDHFCNMENYNINIKYCEECNLKFVDTCYSRHEHLHTQNTVTIDSFVIIDCDYSLLLSDKWQKVFNKLSKDQLRQVLYKSIYNEIRDVRMELLCDGDIGNIYKCSICNVSVDLQFIVDHVKSRECDVEDAKFTCTICNVGFRQKNASNAHEQKHELSDAPYRIVTFNDPKNLFIDEALIKSARADDLKFIRCQYCGKLINKSLFRMHTYKHNYRKVKLLQSQPFKCKNSVGQVGKGKVSLIVSSKFPDQKSIYRYLICTNCNVALLKYNTHICRNDGLRKKCPKCRVFINATDSSLYRHNKLHEKYPTLSHKTIKVTYFNPGDLKKNVNSKLNHTQKPASGPVTISTQVAAAKLKKKKFIRCVHCTKCLSQKNFRQHRCANNMRIAKCNLCGIHTDIRHFKTHMDMHKRTPFNKNDVIITTFNYKTGEFVCKDEPENTLSIKGGNISTSRDTEPNSDIVIKSDYIRVYKCTKCELLFVCRANLLEHLMGSRGACDSEAGENCDHCNLNFHKSDIKQHKSVQMCKTRKVSKINMCTLLLKNSEPFHESNWLSYCKKCDFYHTNSFKHHFDTEHKNAAKTAPCLKCGIRFFRISLKKHNALHHGRVDVPFSKLNVEVIEDFTLEEAGYVSKTQNVLINSTQPVEENNSDGTETTKKDGSANLTTKIKDKIKTVNIYKCTTCNLHFHLRTSLLSHHTKSEHGVEQVPCKICSMPFSKTTINYHVKMHEVTNTFNIIDHLDKSSSRESWFNSSNMSLNTSDTMEPTSDNTVLNDECKATSNSKTVPANQPSQSNLPYIEVKIREAADSSGTSSNEISSTNSISHASEVKLFKCGICDVYFLTAECCSYHTENHSPLDPTEYIACKICDLQFLNRSLDEHMKGHREKSFNMDTLVVDEYQPDGQNIQIDTYSAIDRLKSKLVSTTTESD